MSISNTIIFLVVLCGGGIAGQIALSRMHSKWPGLMLPLVTLLFAVFATMGVVLPFGSETELLITMIFTFLWANIPTVILLVIYFLCRRKYKRQAEISKMTKQDLDEM